MDRPRPRGRTAPALPLPALLLAAALAAALPGTARGESYLDLFAGQSRTSSDNVSVTLRPFLWGTTERASRHVSFDPALALGARLRAWYSRALWLGGGGEVSYYRAQGDHVTVDAIPLSLQLLVRAPLVPDPAYPVGRLHPYAGVGVSVILYRTRVDLAPEVSHDVSAWSGAPGIQAMAGVAAGITPRTFLYAEARYAKFDASVDTGDSDFSLSDDEAHVDAASTQLLLGVSFRLDDDPPRPAPAAGGGGPAP
jgi:opacity protein-like surface antigen